MSEELSIDSEFSELGWPLSDEERRLLRENLLEHGCRDPILVWANHDNVILDGHNRYSICTAEEISYKVKAIRLETRQDCIDFICNLQLSRRNSSEQHKMYLRGKRYNAEKLERGRPSVNSEGPSELTRASDLAEEVGVSSRTLQKDGQFAEAVDELAKPVKDAVMSGDLKASRADVQALAELPKSEQRKVVAAVQSGEAKSVKDAIAPPPAEDKPAAKDKIGGEVPKHLESVAGDTTFADAVATLNKVKKAIRSKATPPFNQFLDIEKVVTGIDQARNCLVNAQFFCVCPKCSGAKRGCGECRRAGWVPLWRKQEMEIHARGK